LGVNVRPGAEVGFPSRLGVNVRPGAEVGFPSRLGVNVRPDADTASPSRPGANDRPGADVALPSALGANGREGALTGFVPRLNRGRAPGAAAFPPPAALPSPKRAAEPGLRVRPAVSSRRSEAVPLAETPAASAGRDPPRGDRASRSLRPRNRAPSRLWRPAEPASRDPLGFDSAPALGPAPDRAASDPRLAALPPVTVLGRAPRSPPAPVPSDAVAPR
jgi:hypothetical protein